MIHLFRDCPKALVIWNTIGGPITIQRSATLDWEAWIAANIFQKNCKFLNMLWPHLFIFVCWFLWKWRNKYIFDVSFHGPHDAIPTIMRYVSEWENATKKVDCSPSTQVCLLNWKKPPPGTLKLNVDGTRSSRGNIGAAGVFRDSEGNWFHGFMLNIGVGEVLQAEAWGLASGLQLAKDLNITHIEVESDSAVLINILQSTDLDLHPLGTLLANCKTILESFDSCSISHIHRERNMVADCLAKRSLDAEFGLSRLPTMPEFVVNAVIDDMAGFARPRTIRTESAAAAVD